MTGRKKIIRQLSVQELNQFLAETDDEKESKRLTFLKRVYKGPSLADAVDDVGKSGSTGSRWAKRWNEGGLGLLTPNFGDGRPPKLDELEQQQLIERLPEGEPWKKPHHLGIDLVFLPVGSPPPQLNPIEPVWKSVKFESSPFIVENGDEYRSRISQLFHKLTEKLSFAATWIKNHLKGFLHKLSQ